MRSLGVVSRQPLSNAAWAAFQGVIHVPLARLGSRGVDLSGGRVDDVHRLAVAAANSPLMKLRSSRGSDIETPRS